MTKPPNKKSFIPQRTEPGGSAPGYYRGGDIVVHALMPVFIFRGKVVVLGEDKERQKPDRGILHLEHPRHPP